MNFLLIDDSTFDREMLRRLLATVYPESSITMVETAPDLFQALRSSRYDCIFLDYAMPSLNGLDLLRELKSRDVQSHAPVIMLTGEGNEFIATRAIKAGCADYLRKQDLSPTTLSQAITHAKADHARQLSERKRRELVEYWATHDELTGLGNRNQFNEIIATRLATARETKERFGLCMIDLDGFKRINDACGHQAGDTVLKSVARKMERVMRSGDHLFRFGGDEFCVLLGVESMPSGIRIAGQRILRALIDEIISEAGPLPLGASIGMAVYPDHAEDIDELLRLADMAMYAAKNEGSGVKVVRNIETLTAPVQQPDRRDAGPVGAVLSTGTNATTDRD